MFSIGDLQKKVPTDGSEVVVVAQQDDSDIIKWIMEVHNEYAGDYDFIYKDFDKGDIYRTCRGLWDFLKHNFTYKAEGLRDQTVRCPYMILEAGQKIDCKHYSLFIGGVLDAIKRHKGGNWDWGYTFASYNGKDVAAHVFVTVFEKKRGEIWVDPVLNSFNEDLVPDYLLTMRKD